jgi:two-component system nitrogen regulation response regulator GlnG
MLLALKTTRPDLVISDIQMPGVDGLKLLELMHENFPEIPVIIMTAYSDFQTTIESYKKGAFEYLAKPFDIEYMLTMVKAALGHSGLSGQHGGGKPRAIQTQWQIELEQHVNILLKNGQSNIAHTLSQQIEEIFIQSALQHTDGHKQKAAKALGWGRNTLTRKIKSLER